MSEACQNNSAKPDNAVKATVLRIAIATVAIFTNKSSHRPLSVRYKSLCGSEYAKAKDS